MSDAAVLAIIAAVPATLLALATLIVSIRNSTKTDTVIAKTDEIHTSTNSNLSKVSAALDVANAKIEGLRETVAATKTKTKGKP